ncbi:hypothetical protein PVAP13_9NG401014 [Panicum virgatum]|uniref:Uncharacterized protein n=1 Tax=Panicum virgatum TaxID=38727 RepID=A0A8T0MP69_PANVG|nr:hypothetical protein PVAP13_9NG401014 [Panicum virgatum]
MLHEDAEEESATGLFGSRPYSSLVRIYSQVPISFVLPSSLPIRRIIRPAATDGPSPLPPRPPSAAGSNCGTFFAIST